MALRRVRETLVGPSRGTTSGPMRPSPTSTGVAQHGQASAAVNNGNRVMHGAHESYLTSSALDVQWRVKRSPASASAGQGTAMV